MTLIQSLLFRGFMHCILKTLQQLKYFKLVCICHLSADISDVSECGQFACVRACSMCVLRVFSRVTCTSPLVWVQSIAVNVSVCLSVYLSVYLFVNSRILKNHMSKLHTPHGAGVHPFRLCCSLVHALPHLLLFITFPFFLFSNRMH